MNIYSLYVGYESKEPVKKVEAVNHRQAANYFRSYVIEELGKTSLYGFVVKRDDFKETNGRGELVRVPYDLYVSLTDLERMKKGEEGIGYTSIEHIGDKMAYERISKHAFQPAIQIDNNTYNVVLILK